MSAMKGAKRGSPGADPQKHVLDAVELSDADARKLSAVQHDIARAELVLEREAVKRMKGAYSRRREVLKTIPKFWPIALLNHSLVAYHAQHSADQTALSYLEDVWVAREEAEPRVYTLELYFKENPYFSDKVLRKEYKYVPAPLTREETPDEDGITNSMIEFEWERDVVRSATKINWKSDNNALTKLYPREVVEDDEDDDDDIGDPGSFFNFFEHEVDPSNMGSVIVETIFPEAIDYFLGNAGGEDDDSDEDSEDDDLLAEIDLERPKAKKPRV